MHVSLSGLPMRLPVPGRGFDQGTREDVAEAPLFSGQVK
jgi:hypothetical protein